MDLSPVNVFENLPSVYIDRERVREFLSDVPSSYALTLLQCERLRYPLSHRIKQHYQLEPIINPDQQDLRIAQYEKSALEQIISVAGAVCNGHRLRVTIAGAAINSVLSGIHPQAYNIAVKHAELIELRPEADETSILTKERMLEDGRSCFLGWLCQLAPSIRSRVELKFPRSFVEFQVQKSFDLAGPPVIRTVAVGLASHG